MAQPVRPESPPLGNAVPTERSPALFSAIPPDALTTIWAWADRPLQIAPVNRHWSRVVGTECERLLRSIPSVDALLQRSSLLQPYHLKQTAAWLRATVCLCESSRRGDVIPYRVRPPIPFNDLLRLSNLLSWYDFLVGAIEHNDHSIFNSFDWNALPPMPLVFAISLSLEKGNLILSQRLLRLLSHNLKKLTDVDLAEYLRRIVPKHEALIVQAALTRHYDIFQQLLSWGVPNDPHPQRQLANPNTLLCLLTNDNLPQAIEILLNSHEVDVQYHPVPLNAPRHVAGLQVALLIAATRDHADVLETIFRLKPGNQIDRRILSYIIAYASLLLVVGEDGEINPVAQRVVDRFQRERSIRYPDQEGFDDNLGLFADAPAAPAPAPAVMPPIDAAPAPAPAVMPPIDAAPAPAPALFAGPEKNFLICLSIMLLAVALEAFFKYFSPQK